MKRDLVQLRKKRRRLLKDISFLSGEKEELIEQVEYLKDIRKKLFSESKNCIEIIKHVNHELDRRQG